MARHNGPHDEIMLLCDEKGELQQLLRIYMVSGVCWNVNLGAKVSSDEIGNLRITQPYNPDNPHKKLAAKEQVLVLKAKYVEAVAYTK